MSDAVMNAMRGIGWQCHMQLILPSGM